MHKLLRRPALYAKPPLIKSNRLVLAVMAIIAAAGLSAASVLASAPDDSKVINGCYNNHGLLRIVDSSAACNGNETAISWNQRGPASSSASNFKFAVQANQVSLSVAESQAQANDADLGGPSVTVNVPDSPGTLVVFYISSEAALPCNITARVFVVDEATGQMIDPQLSAYASGMSSPDFNPITSDGQVSGLWRSIAASPGTHTYSLRYGVYPWRNNSACSATFRNTKLWAEVKAPN